MKSCPYGRSACISLHFSDVPVHKNHSENLSSQHYRKFPNQKRIYKYVSLRFDDISKTVVYQKPEERQYDQSMLYVQHILSKNGKPTDANL